MAAIVPLFPAGVISALSRDPCCCIPVTSQSAIFRCGDPCGDEGRSAFHWMASGQPFEWCANSAFTVACPHTFFIPRPMCELAFKIRTTFVSLIFSANDKIKDNIGTGRGIIGGAIGKLGQRRWRKGGWARPSRGVGGVGGSSRFNGDGYRDMFANNFLKAGRSDKKKYLVSSPLLLLSMVLETSASRLRQHERRVLFGWVA